MRAGNRQGFFLGRLGQRAREVRDYAVTSQWKTDASNRASGLLFQFGIDIFRAAAMLTVLFSDLSIGQMLAVFSYLWFMIGPVEQLLNLQYAYYAAGGALSRINELLARDDEPQYPGGVDPFQGRDTVGIEVQGLSFGYGDELVLNQMDLSIAPPVKKWRLSVPAVAARAPWCSCCWGCTRPLPGPSASVARPSRRSAWRPCAKTSPWSCNIRRCSMTRYAPI
ncbi:ABC-type bacteriocin/lantibiotic exporter with double-glycine peptidase domain [Pseudomonas silensiensis]|nr:ABC-type bacteriocin/lantibiotic exporter with double-glycine peptidase domain [Pseudomonas silensiensis]